MSIIHEALKKAEREREPRPAGLPLYGRERMVRRRGRWRVTAGMLIGLTALGAMSTWLWPRSQGGGLQVRTAAPRAQGPAAIMWGGEDQTERQAVVNQPLPITKPPAVVRPAESEQVSSPAAASALASEAQTTAQTTFERGREAEVKGQWEEAKRYYRQALALNPTLVEARNNLGALFVHQQQLTAAIDEFQAAVQLDPNSAIVRNNLGSAYFLSGQEGLAIQEFLAALRIDGTYVSPLYNLASLYARRSDVGQVVAFLTRALAIEPAVWSWLQDDPDFDGIKATPEIQRLRPRGYAKR
jgi:tetratricopeptide (TPR) repeat protein